MDVIESRIDEVDASGPVVVEGRADDGTTWLVADFAANFSYADISADVVHDTKRIILDTLACAIAAAETAPGQALIRFKSELGGRADSTMIGSATKLPVGSAAYVNSQLANLLDADETLGWAHFASAIVMPALAVAEMQGSTGQDVIAAVAIGYEVGARLAKALTVWKDVGPDGTLLHPPALGFSWASFGTAAATGRLLGLDREQMRHAFGLAHMASPVHSWAPKEAPKQPPWNKYGMYGAIAEAGLNAALLARQGFISNATVLDESSQFYRSFCTPAYDPGPVVTDLGKRWHIAETSIKPWPACRCGHGALDAFASIVHEQDLTAADVESVVVKVPRFGTNRVLAATNIIKDPMTLMWSLPYGFAMIIGKVPSGPRWWASDVFSNPDHHAFAAKVQAGEVDRTFSDAFVSDVVEQGTLTAGKIPMEVEVSAKGQVFARSALYAHGENIAPREFRMTDQELRQKVTTFTSGQMPVEAASEMADAAFALDSDNKVDRLMRPVAESVA